MPTQLHLVQGDHAAAQLRAAAQTCARLHDRPEPLSHAHPPPGSYTGQLPQGQLAALFPARHPLDAPTRNNLAEDFARIRDQTGLLRRWDHGKIVGVPLERYDPLLLNACPTSWTPAARVVGAAMAACDPANRLSDLFLATRLRALIASGAIEADRQGATLRDYAVRLPCESV